MLIQNNATRTLQMVEGTPTLVDSAPFEINPFWLSVDTYKLTPKGKFYNMSSDFTLPLMKMRFTNGFIPPSAGAIQIDDKKIAVNIRLDIDEASPTLTGKNNVVIARACNLACKQLMKTYAEEYEKDVPYKSACFENEKFRTSAEIRRMKDSRPIFVRNSSSKNTETTMTTSSAFISAKMKSTWYHAIPGTLLCDTFMTTVRNGRRCDFGKIVFSCDPAAKFDRDVTVFHLDDTISYEAYGCASVKVSVFIGTSTYISASLTKVELHTVPVLSVYGANTAKITPTGATKHCFETEEPTTTNFSSNYSEKPTTVVDDDEEEQIDFE